MQEDGTEARIDHWVNKMWKIGGSITATLRQKLEFLYSNERQQQVGMYLRNQSVADPQFSDVYAKREDCERTHNHIKATLKFDVRRVSVECQSFCPNLVTVFMSAFKSTQQVLEGESDHGNPDQSSRIL